MIDLAIVQLLAVMLPISCASSSPSEGEMIATTVTDISGWQPNPDWSQVIQSGIEIVIQKATQGTTFVEKTYAPRKAAARAAGLKYWGAYHFADGSDGAEQAEHFLKIAGDADFLAIDLEINPSKNTVTSKQADELALAIYNQTGRYPLVYGSPNFLNGYLEFSKTLAKCPLWVANWVKYPPKIPNMWDQWVLWQYTDGVHGPEPHNVPGIGNCDRSKVNTTAFLSYLNSPMRDV